MSNETSPKQPSIIETHQEHMGLILALLVIILLVVLGGLYVWGATLAKNEENEARVERVIPNNEPETVRALTDQEIMETVSSSSDLEAIYADLESTNLDALDAELTQIEAEMNVGR